MSNDFIDMGERVDDLKDDLGDNIDSHVEDAVDDTAERAAHNVRRNDSRAHGELLAHLVTGAEVHDPSKLASYKVSAPREYKVLEFGSGQRRDKTADKAYKSPDPKPPLEPILSWITAKGIQPDPDGPYDTQVGLAVAIQETIGDLGTRPHPFVRPAWYSQYGRTHIKGEARKAMRKSVRRV